MNELKEVIKHLEFILDITESDLTEDIEKLKIVNKHLEAINYTHCCTELKDKEVLTFEEWLSNFEKTEDNNYWLNKEVLYCKEAMLLHYNDLPDE